MSQTADSRAETEGRLTIADESAAPVHLTATESSGEWTPPDALREAALAILARDSKICVSLASVEHLDTSALQVLLALSAGVRGQDHTVELADVSPALRKWFGYAGATALLERSADSRGPAEVAKP